MVLSSNLPKGKYYPDFMAITSLLCFSLKYVLEFYFAGEKWGGEVIVN
jgi:hypothetical protein